MTWTNNIYTSIYHILNSYDMITQTDLSGISSTRASWLLGRQITEQKSSKEYLKELARQSFICFYPTRSGDIAADTWYDNQTTSVTHDESGIIEGSIRKFEKTPITKVYNDFNIKYQYNPETKLFEKSYAITKTNDPGGTGFPERYESVETGGVSDYIVTVYNNQIQSWYDWGDTWRWNFDVEEDPTDWMGRYISFDSNNGMDINLAEIIYTTDLGGGVWRVGLIGENKGGWPKQNYLATDTGTMYLLSSCIRKWTTYASGFSDYTTAKAWWELCNDSYNNTLVVNPLPKDLSECYWYADNKEFGVSEIQNAAYNYLQYLVEWATRQKYIVEYDIPMTAANAQLELLDPIYFSDAKYTGGTSRLGWINRIKVRPSKNVITLEVILEPYDITERNYIIETGSQTDTIEETGSQTDTYTEGAQ